jgi:hypothetical protein
VSGPRFFWYTTPSRTRLHAPADMPSTASRERPANQRGFRAACSPERSAPRYRIGATTTYCTDVPTYCGWYQVPPQLL